MNRHVAISDLTITRTFGIDFVASIAGVFQDENIAVESLSSLDGRVRCAAIESLVKFWLRPCGELKEYFESLISDESEDVRVFAISLLVGPAFDHEICDWAEERLDSALRMPNASDRERNALERGLSLRSHRKFRGKGVDLIDDTNALLRKWDQFNQITAIGDSASNDGSSDSRGYST